MMLPVHERFIKQAKKKISRDNRLTGLLAGGSMIHGAMDEYSDLDLVIVYDNAYRNEIMEQTHSTRRRARTITVGIHR